jgi:hypothetical protein
LLLLLLLTLMMTTKRLNNLLAAYVECRANGVTIAAHENAQRHRQLSLSRYNG